MKQPAIRAKQITKEFAGGVRALSGVSIDIAQGELFFLLGGSGCGKTTLLRCIAGLESPTSGHVYFDGSEVTQLPTHKREAAMVFQSYALWPHLNVGQNVAFGLEERKVPKGEIRRRVAEALEMVELAGYETRGIHQMSGGQQQRVSLARALVVRPKCLLLDEPLSNLDARLRLEMRTEIRRIVKENNLTAVYVTHDQEEALSTADRMAIMEQGHVRQVGTPEQIYREPRTAMVAQFIGETNLLPVQTESDIRAVNLDSAPENKANHWTQVETDHGTFLGQATGEGEAAGGDKLVVSIRPEAWQRVSNRTGESNLTSKNQLQVKIRQRVYLGDLIQYVGETEQGQKIHFSELNPHLILEPGEDLITLEARPEDVVILTT